MQSLFVYFDITTLLISGKKTQGLCHVIYIFFLSSLGNVKLCKVSSLQDMCVRFYGGVLPPPS